MGDKTGSRAEAWQRLSARERALILGAAATLLSFVLYQFPFLVQERTIGSLHERLKAEQTTINELTVRIAELNRRKAENAVSPGWELADQKSVILLLEDVSGEAKRVGVSLVAVHPTREIDKEKYKEVSMNLDLKGRYRELADYFKRLESLSKVVNVRKVRLESCPDTASVCAAQIEAVTYMAK